MSDVGPDLRASRGHVVYGVTSGMSADVLLRGQLRWLISQGWRITLATTPDEASRRAAVREGVELHGIVMRREISLAADLRALIDWVRFLAQNRPDAVNISTPKAGLLGHIAAWLTRVPRRLYVVRGLRAEGAKGFNGAVLWLMEWLTMRLATDIVFVSRSLAREAQRRKLIAPGAGYLIGAGSSNGVDADAVAARSSQTPPSDLRQALGIPIDAFVVGFVGRATADKGIRVLTTALQLPAVLKSCHLLIVGNLEDPSLMPDLDSLGDRVHVTGWTNDVWGQLAAIDVLCLPTQREGFPNAVLEAAAAGTPSIVTNATGAVDSVVNGQTGIVVAVDDAEALAEQISRLAADPALRAKLGDAARARVKADFEPHRIWSGIDAILCGDNLGHDVTPI